MMRTLLTNWSFARVVRLVLALMFLVAGYSKGDAVAYFAAAFFGVQALLNLGCCGTSCTSVERAAAIEGEVTDVSYKEVH
jgi:hypothetical protein